MDTFYKRFVHKKPFTTREVKSCINDLNESIKKKQFFRKQQRINSLILNYMYISITLPNDFTPIFHQGRIIRSDIVLESIRGCV